MKGGWGGGLSHRKKRLPRSERRHQQGRGSSRRKNLRISLKTAPKEKRWIFRRKSSERKAAIKRKKTLGPFSRGGRVSKKREVGKEDLRGKEG